MNKIVAIDIVEVYPETAKGVCDHCAHAEDRLFLVKGLFQLFCEPCPLALKGFISGPVSPN